MNNPLPKEYAACRALALDLAKKMKAKHDAVEKIKAELQKAEDDYKLLYAQIEALKKELDELIKRHEANWQKLLKDFEEEKNAIMKIVEKLKSMETTTPKQKEALIELQRILKSVLEEMERAVHRLRDNEAIKQLKSRIEMLLETAKPKQALIDDLKKQVATAQALLDEAKKLASDQNKLCEAINEKLKKVTEQYHIDANIANKIFVYFDALYYQKKTEEPLEDSAKMKAMMEDFMDRTNKSITTRCEKEQEACDKKSQEFRDKIDKLTKMEKEMADKLQALKNQLPEAQKALSDALVQYTMYKALYEAKCKECDNIVNNNPLYGLLTQFLKDLAAIKELLAKILNKNCINDADVAKLNALLDDIVGRVNQQIKDKLNDNNDALKKCLEEKAKLFDLFNHWGKVKAQADSALKKIEADITSVTNELKLIRGDKKNIMDLLEAHLTKCKNDIRTCLGDNLWKIEAVAMLKQLISYLP